MGQVLHGNASTTAAIRRAIQHSQESLRVLAKRFYYETRFQQADQGAPKRLRSAFLSSFPTLVLARASTCRTSGIAHFDMTPLSQ